MTSRLGPTNRVGCVVSDLLDPEPQAQCLRGLPPSRAPCWPEHTPPQVGAGRRADSQEDAGAELGWLREALKSGTHQPRPLASERAGVCLALGCTWDFVPHALTSSQPRRLPRSQPPPAVTRCHLLLPVAAAPPRLGSFDRPHSPRPRGSAKAERNNTTLGSEDDGTATRPRRGATPDSKYDQLRLQAEPRPTSPSCHPQSQVAGSVRSAFSQAPVASWPALLTEAAQPS